MHCQGRHHLQVCSFLKLSCSSLHSTFGGVSLEVVAAPVEVQKGHGPNDSNSQYSGCTGALIVLCLHRQPQLNARAGKQAFTQDRPCDQNQAQCLRLRVRPAAVCAFVVSLLFKAV